MANEAGFELPIPEHHRSEDAGRWAYAPNLQTLFESACRWRRMHGLRPSVTDRVRVGLLLIDMQKDFCLPEGALFVGGRSGRGALGDADRLARWIYRHLGWISEIVVTLDTHHPHQVFSPTFWIDENGDPPLPFTVIEPADLEAGRWRPNPEMVPLVAGGDSAWLERYALHYVRMLARNGRDPLHIWPPHCLLGTEGHALTGVIAAARAFHAYARTAKAPVITKGEEALTESYSALRSEVVHSHDGRQVGEVRSAWIERLLGYDVLVIAGEAASHCVRATVFDLLEAACAKTPSRSERIYVLRDAMSAVAVPDGKGGFLADYTPNAEEAFARVEEAGAHVVESAVPVERWPGIAAVSR